MRIRKDDRRHSLVCTGQVRITLVHTDLDEIGWPARAAEVKVWNETAGLPDGVTVTLDLGPARWFSRRLLEVAIEQLGPGSRLVIEGSARVVSEAMASWRSLAG